MRRQSLPIAITLVLLTGCGESGGGSPMNQRRAADRPAVTSAEPPGTESATEPSGGTTDGSPDGTQSPEPSAESTDQPGGSTSEVTPTSKRSNPGGGPQAKGSPLKVPSFNAIGVTGKEAWDALVLVIPSCDGQPCFVAGEIRQASGEAPSPDQECLSTGISPTPGTALRQGGKIDVIVKCEPLEPPATPDTGTATKTSGGSKPAGTDGTTPDVPAPPDPGSAGAGTGDST